MFWWFVGGWLIGALSTLFVISICNVCSKEVYHPDPEQEEPEERNG